MRLPAKLTIIINLAILFAAILAINVDAPEFTLVNSLSAHQPTVLAKREFSLNHRYENDFVNGVFKDNILLNIAYLTGKVKSAKDVSWSDVQKPSVSEITLQPGEVFAYHDNVLPEYQGKVTKTTNAHFDAYGGFRSSGKLYGDGVCHLASLINWAARDAGLEVNAPTRHDFAYIPEVPVEYGTSILYAPGNARNSSMQNMYIENTKDKEVTFQFTYDGDEHTVSVLI